MVRTQCFCLLGVGKSTLVQKVCDAVVSAGGSVSGFYTEEVREQGRRVGFDVVTLTGDRGRLSRIRYLLVFVSPSVIRCSCVFILTHSSVFDPALNPPQVDVNAGSDSTWLISSRLRLSLSLFSETYVWMDDFNVLYFISVNVYFKWQRCSFVYSLSVYYYSFYLYLFILLMLVQVHLQELEYGEKVHFFL